MSATRLEQAEQHRQQTERVRTMAAKLRALIEGRATRADVMKWTRELWPPGSGQGGPFISGEASSIFSSIWNLDEQWGDGPLVRDVDLRGYLRWLSEGETFHADENDPLVILDRDLTALAAQVGGEVIRWWLDGIGWCCDLRFCAPARGRAFMAGSTLRRPGSVEIFKLRGDDPHDALIELFEALAIDDEDCKHISPAINLSRLPVWALWREDDNVNRFEVARFRSYAKARAHEQIFTARGHKQTYWVDPA